MIDAIETLYAGCRFRSRLEARWAVAFNALGIEWMYEPQGYEIDVAGEKRKFNEDDTCRIFIAHPQSAAAGGSNIAPAKPSRRGLIRIDRFTAIQPRQPAVSQLRQPNTSAGVLHQVGISCCQVGDRH